MDYTIIIARRVLSVNASSEQLTTTIHANAMEELIQWRRQDLLQGEAMLEIR